MTHIKSYELFIAESIEEIEEDELEEEFEDIEVYKIKNWNKY